MRTMCLKAILALALIAVSATSVAQYAGQNAGATPAIGVPGGGGGSISLPVSVANGGTGASTLAGARSTLGVGTSVTQLIANLYSPNLVGLYLFDATDCANGSIRDQSGNGNNITLPTGTGAPTLGFVGGKCTLTWASNTSQSNGLSIPGITNPATMQGVWNYVQPATKTGSYSRTPYGYSATNGFYFYESQYAFGTPAVPPAVYNFSGTSLLAMPSGNGSNLLTLSLSAAGNSYFLNSQQYVPIITATATAPPTNGNLEIGMCHNSSCLGYNAPYSMSLSFLAVYGTAALTTAQTLANFDAISKYVSSFGVTLGGTPTNAALSPVPYTVTCDTTSIDGGTGGNQTPCLNMTLGSNYAVKIAAIASSTLGQRVANSLGLEQQFINPASTNIIIFGGPVTNDLCAANGTVSSAAQAWALTAQALALAKAKGFQAVGVGTMISRGGNSQNAALTGSTCDSLKNAWNALVRQNVTAVGAFLFDLAEFPGLGADGAYANTISTCGSGGALACFTGDGTHPTSAGEQTIGTYEQNVILANTGFTGSVPNSQAGTSYTLTTADRVLLNPITAASTRTLPDCNALTGYTYQLVNTSATYSITVSAVGSQTITGSTTIAPQIPATYRVQLSSPTAGGCYWLRTE